MLRTIDLDQETILYLGVLIGAATKQNDDPFVRKAAENVFSKVYERPREEIIPPTINLSDVPGSLVNDFFDLLVSEHREIIQGMGFCLSPQVQEKINKLNPAERDREKDKMFLFQMRKEGRLLELARRIKEIKSKR